MILYRVGIHCAPQRGRVFVEKHKVSMGGRGNKPREPQGFSAATVPVRTIISTNARLLAERKQNNCFRVIFLLQFLFRRVLSCTVGTPVGLSVSLVQWYRPVGWFVWRIGFRLLGG